MIKTFLLSKRHKICAQCATIITFLYVISMPLIIQIKYPTLNVSIELVEKDESTYPLDSKRANGANDCVWARYPALHYDKMGVVIKFICNVGDETNVDNVTVAVGAVKAAKYTNINDENISVNDLEVIQMQKGMKLKVTGPYPYIRIDNIMHTIVWAVIVNALIVFIFFFLSFEFVCYLKLELARKEIRMPIFCLREISIVILLSLGFYFVIIQKNILELKQHQSWEMFFLLLSVIGVKVVFRTILNITDWKKCLLGVSLIFPFLLISIQDITTYLTVDERMHIMEHYMIDMPYMGHWLGNSARMSYSIMGSIWKIIPENVVELISYEQLAKLLHWGLGVILILTCAIIITKRILEAQQDTKKVFYVVVVTDIMLAMPLMDLALKTYNYDLISLLFSILAVLKLILYVRDKRKTDAIWTLVLATGAIIEKMPASIVWLVCLVVLVAEVSSERARDTKQYPFMTLKWTIVFCMSAWLLVYANSIYVLDILMESGPYHNMLDEWNMLCSMFEMGIRFVVGDVFTDEQYLIVTTVCLISGIWLVSMIYLLIKELVVNIKKEIFYKIIPMVLLGVTVAGIGMAFLPEIDTVIISRMDYLVYYIKEYFRIIPTTIILICIIELCLGVINIKKENYMYLVAGCSLFGASLFFTLVYNTEFISSRYSAIYISIYILALVISMLQRIGNKQQLGFKHWLVVGVLVVFTCCELSASLPAFTVFYPYYYNPIIQEDELGVYAFWGECNSVASKDIIAYCEENEIDIKDITICDSYIGAWHGGEWLTNEDGIELGPRGWVYSGYENPSETDFFIFETQTLIRDEFPYGMPQDVEPIITMKYHGAVTARIYRGDMLVEYFQQYSKM